MTSPVAFAAVLISLSIYVVVARRAVRARFGAPAQLPRDFFLARHRYGGEEFAASQIAYQLQMSTVYPFVIWAATGDWSLALWNTLFYLVGIGLFLALIRRFKESAFNIIDSPKTLHDHMARIHRVPGLRMFTALLSVIGFAGLAVFEIVWGATAFKVLFGGSSAIFYVAIVVLALYLTVYFWVGGQGAAIRTDQYQLLLGYIGLHALVAWSITRPSVSLAHLAAPFLVAWTAVISCLMLIWRLGAWRLLGRARYLRVLNLLTLASVAVMLVFLVRVSSSDWRSALTLPAFHPTDPVAFHWQLATLAILPFFFQFVDMTNWQRIASLKDTRDLRKGLIQYLLESPLSWLFPVIIGLCAPMILGNHFTGDFWEGLLAKLCGDQSITGALLASLVLVAIVAIFMSTAESLISAIGYAYAYDISSSSRYLIDSTDESDLSDKDRDLIIRTGRRAMACILGIVVFLFIVVDILASKGGTLLGLFLSFYTPMLAFAPAVLLPAILKGKRIPSAFWTWTSIAGGSLVGIAIGIASTVLGGISQWLAAPAVLVVSWVAYLLGIIVAPQPNRKGTA